MSKQWQNVLLLMIVLTLGVSTASGEKGGKGKPSSDPDLYEAGSFLLGDQTGDAIFSDSGGAYADGENGIEYVHDLVNWSTAESRGHTGDRTLAITLGTCISEVCESPFGDAQSASVSSEVLLGSFTNEEGDAYLGNGLPGPGETFDNGGSVTLFFQFSGETYFLRWDGPNGEIVGTGHDDDNDGEADRTVVTVSNTARVLLYKLVYSTTTRGKKTQTTSSWEPAGEFSNMPFQMTFSSIGYLRTLPVMPILDF